MSFILLGILNSQAAGGGGGAFDLLETTTLTSTASSVTFSGLGAYSDYKHLQIRVLARGDDNGTLNVEFNNDTGANYAAHRLMGNGSTVFSNGYSGLSNIRISNAIPDSGATSVEFGPAILDILDFSNSNKNSTVRTFAGASSDYLNVQIHSGLWNNTNAITSIKLNNFDLTGFQTNSRFSLYGVK